MNDPMLAKVFPPLSLTSCCFMGEETKLPKGKEAAYSYCNCGSHLALVKNTSVFICNANGQMAGRLAAYSLPLVLHSPSIKNNLVHEIHCSAGKGTGPQALLLK